MLLRNEGDVLPLSKGMRIAVVGPMAYTRNLLSDYAGDQQCMNGLECIPTVAEAITWTNGAVPFGSAGCDVNSNNKSGFDAALHAVREADVTVLVLGIDKSIERETLDRNDTALPGVQTEFGLSVLSIGKPVILVLLNGGALAIDKLLFHSPGPAAIVEGYNLNTVGSKALAAALFGEENRWGRLVTTMYPHSYVHEQPMDNYDMVGGS